MRMTIGFLGFWCLIGSACSDDGLTAQNPLDSTSSTGGSPTAGPTTDQNAETGPAGSSGGSDGPADPTGEASTGMDPTADTGTGTSGPPMGTDTGTSTGTGDTGTTGEPCMPLSDDPSAIGMDCMSDLDCPDGYQCQPFQGFAFQLQCQILCAQTCECPLGLTCNMVMDKSGASWTQCE